MSLLQFYHYVNNELADVRTKDWILLSSPIPVVLITLSYLYFVLKCGPRYMKNRPAYSCLTFVKFYNVFQIAANACIVYQIIENGWYQDVWLKCVEYIFPTDHKSMKYASLAWYLLCLKLVDYTETVVFVLRKKQRQVSFLNLYHHVTVVLLSWLQAKYYAIATLMTAVLVNSMVHVIMYTYYLFSSMRPELRAYANYIKPMVTQIQIVQFVFLAVYAVTYSLICDGPRGPVAVFVLILVSNLAMFYNFYKKTYRTGKKEK